MEHVMGSFHENLIHGAGLIMIAHAYNASSGKDFVAALDKLIAEIGCADLKMSDEGISKDELKKYPQKIHEVLGGNIAADPLPLSDADYLEIFEKAWK